MPRAAPDDPLDSSIRSSPGRREPGDDVLGDELNHEYLQLALGETATIISGFVGIFEQRRDGAIHFRDIKRLQTELAELGLGAKECKSLVKFLLTASSAVAGQRRNSVAGPMTGLPGSPSGAAGHRGSRVAATAAETSAAGRRGSAQRKGSDAAVKPATSTLAAAQFNLGVVSWIAAEAAAGNGGTEAESAASAPEVEGNVSAPVPRLALGKGNGEDEEDEDGADVESQRQREAEEHRDSEQVQALLAQALAPASAHFALADHIQTRVDVDKLALNGLVESAELHSMITHLVTVRVDGLTNADVEGWCQERLGLNIRDARSSAAEPETGAGSAPGTHSTASDLGKRAQDPEVVKPRATWFMLLHELRNHTGKMTDNDERHLSSLLLNSLETGGASKRPLHERVAAAFGLAYALVPSQGTDAAIIPKYVLLHTSAMNKCVGGLFIVFVAFDCLVIPLQLSFISESQRMTWLTTLNYAMDAFYIGRVALNFITSFENENSVTEYDPRAIAKQYLSTRFAADLLAAFPLNIIALSGSAPARVIFAYRLPRLVNVRHLISAYRLWQLKMTSEHLLLGLTTYLGVLLAAAHLSACIWHLSSVSPSNTAKVHWTDLQRAAEEAVGGPLPQPASPEGGLVYAYIDALYFAIAMLTTLGLNQLPANPAELGTFLFLMLLNMTVYAWTVGQISAEVMKQDAEVVTKRAELEAVQNYVASIEVPPELAEEISTFFHARLEGSSLTATSEEQIHAALPSSLRFDIAMCTSRSLVGACSLLRKTSETFLDRVSAVLDEELLEPEASLFRKGDVSRKLFFVNSGVIEVYDDAVEGSTEPPSVDQHGSGEVIGSIPFVFAIRHFQHARAGAGAEARIFVLARESYRDLIKAFPDEEDTIMDAAVAEFDGAMSARSARSKASALTGMSAGTTGSTGTHVEAGDVPAIIAEARKKKTAAHHRTLCQACFKGDLDGVRKLIGLGDADVNRQDPEGRRPLHLAACEGHLPVVKLLVATRADLSVEDSHGGTPLSDALIQRHYEVADYLWKQGAKRSDRDLGDDLCAAAEEVDASPELRSLCLYGSDLSTGDAYGRTAMHCAAACGHVENLRLLLKNKGDPNALDKGGATALQEAYRSNADADACASLLIEHGGHMGTFDVARHMCAAAAEGDTDTLALLLKFRCEVNVTDNLGRTPLHVAASSRQISACHFLLTKAEVKVNVEDTFGNTPWDDAAREEQSAEHPVLQTLLASHGGKPGTHKRAQVSAHAADPEELAFKRSEEEAQEYKNIIDQVEALLRWVNDARDDVQEWIGVVKGALKLERDRGAVLSDEMQSFWGDLRSFVEDDFERTRFVSTELTAKLDAWKDSPAYSAASFAVQAVANTIHVVETQATSAAQTLDRLADAEFKETLMLTTTDKNEALNRVSRTAI